MTIKEMFNANIDMLHEDIFVVHCRFDTSSFGKSTDDTNGCIIYKDEYDIMPEALKGLKVKTFNCLSYTKSLDEHNIWNVWVV